MRFSKILASVLCVVLSAVNVCAAEPDIKALGAVLADRASGRILWQKNADKAFAPASTTKIMTAVIALENAELNDKITVTREAALAPKVRLGLKEGEELTVEQLLYALMLRSANDAAVALAVGIGGSTEKFCEKMTEKAALIGCTDTVFVTPNGLDSGDHHSTPRDMAKIAAYALDNPDFVRIVGTKEVSFSTNKNTYHLTTTDRFLSEYNGAIGIKTGFTGKAGHCFAGAAERDGIKLVSVVFASGWGSAGKESKWTDTKKLMDYGFDNFKVVQPVKKGEFVKKIEVKGGKSAGVDTVFGKDVQTLMKNGEKYSVNCDYPAFVNAPVTAGERLGTAKLVIEGETIAEVPIIAATDVKSMSFADYLEYIVAKWIGIVI